MACLLAIQLGIRTANRMLYAALIAINCSQPLNVDASFKLTQTNQVLHQVRKFLQPAHDDLLVLFACI